MGAGLLWAVSWVAARQRKARDEEAEEERR